MSGSKCPITYLIGHVGLVELPAHEGEVVLGLDQDHDGLHADEELLEWDLRLVTVATDHTVGLGDDGPLGLEEVGPPENGNAFGPRLLRVRSQ